YRCFSAFLDSVMPLMFKEEDVLHAHLSLFTQLLWYHDPQLAEYLANCQMTPDVYAAPWFVTVFARHTPTPQLLDLWERLVKTGEPVLVQFLAVGWVVTNRQLLLETNCDYVPETITRMCIGSLQDVDHLWAAAAEIRAATPCHYERHVELLCYG
ncbi:unnamed protein product, partial [Choristocarpus tenellus]